MTRDTGWNRNATEVGGRAEEVACKELKLTKVSQIADFGGVDAVDKDGARYSIKGDQTIETTGNLYHQVARVTREIPIEKITPAHLKTSANTAAVLVFVTNLGKGYVINTHDFMQIVIDQGITLERIKPTSVGYLVPLGLAREKLSFREFQHQYKDLETGARMPPRDEDDGWIDQNSDEAHAQGWLIFQHFEGCPYNWEGKDRKVLQRTIEQRPWLTIPKKRHCGRCGQLIGAEYVALDRYVCEACEPDDRDEDDWK